jgi:hypothetical protein
MGCTLAPIDFVGMRPADVGRGVEKAVRQVRLMSYGMVSSSSASKGDVVEIIKSWRLDDPTCPVVVIDGLLHHRDNTAHQNERSRALGVAATERAAEGACRLLG